MRAEQRAIGSAAAIALGGLMLLIYGCGAKPAGPTSTSETPATTAQSADKPIDALQAAIERIVAEESERYAPEPRGGHDLTLFLMRSLDQRETPREPPLRLLPKLSFEEESGLFRDCVEEWEQAKSKPFKKTLAPFAEIAQKLELDLDPGVDEYEPQALREFGDYAQIEARRLRMSRDSKIRERLRSLAEPRTLKDAEIEAILKRLAP